MTVPVRIRAVGTASCEGDAGPGARSPFEARLSSPLAELARGGARVRLFCPPEEAAFLAAWDALAASGVSVPVDRDAVGLALGLDEGIDGIKARHSAAVSSEGPLGASPVWFPLTAPNTIAAQLSIALGLRGESHTVCGGTLSGAQAIGIAVQSIRERRHAGMLAGGATWVEAVLLDALARLGRPDGGPPRCAACLLVLVPGGGNDAGAPEVAGYGEAFGDGEIAAAAAAALDDAGLAPEGIGSILIAGAPDPGEAIERLRGAGLSVRAVVSPSARLHSASFPFAVAEAAGGAVVSPPGPVLVVGADCLGGAAAAVVTGGRR
ncbi:MAG: beta-ketoacyl synthase N-terminal-like domain-containing protein [Deltaproteobacteria bacterium]